MAQVPHPPQQNLLLPVPNEPGLAALQQLLHQQIPISQAMQIIVESYREGCLTLAAPLAPNRNHHGTVFGGSLYSLAVLTGWSLLHVQLKALNIPAHIVIFDGHIHYLQAATDRILATASVPAEGRWQRFLQTYERHGKARVHIEVEVLCDQLRVASFDGEYVIQR